ncbi:MAG: thermonuclease family protein [Nanoarchaeota archaeon]
MHKLYALVLALVLTATIANLIFIIKGSDLNELETVTVSRVIDGDTLVLDDKRTIRLININSPEKDSPLSEQATNVLSTLTDKTIQIESLGLEKYGRTLARIYTPEYINLELVQKGLASKFLVNNDELKAFYRAEEKAIESQLGIWHDSLYSNCIKTKVNAKDEEVIIENSCSSINISGWTIKDESRKIYKFNIILNSNLILHTGEGNDQGENLYWKSSNVWNNDRDTLYLFDSENHLVSHYSYGY